MRVLSWARHLFTIKLRFLSVGCCEDEYGTRWEKALYTNVQWRYFVNSKILLNGIWKGCGEGQSTRGAFRRFATWEVKKIYIKESAFRIEEPRHCIGLLVCYVHECSFLTFEFLSWLAFPFTNLLPDSCQSFPTGFVTSFFRLPRRPGERPPAGVAFPRLTSLLCCHWLLLVQDPPPMT